MYKLLLCWRYLRTRYIALASIISVTLGVATMIVVNSVMEGFTSEMQNRIHAILGDMVVESRSLDGMSDFKWQAENIRRIAGDDIAAMSPVVAVPAVLYFDHDGRRFTRQIDLIGIDEATQSSVSGFGDYLQHSANREKMSFQLRPNGYDTRDHQADGTTPEREQMANAGWEHRREVAEREAFQKRYRSTAVPVPSNGRNNGRQNAGPTARDPKAAPAVNPFEGHALSVPQEPDKKFDPATQQNTGAVLGIAMTSYRDNKGVDRFFAVPGDDVKIAFFSTAQPPTIVSDDFTITDFYESKMSEYDARYVFVPIRKLQELRGMIDLKTGVGLINAIQIKLKPGVDGEAVRDKLRAALPDFQYGVYTWRDKQGALLDAVHLETLMLNVLLFLIIAVAGFGILAIFYMIVVEKTRDIGILKSLGASRHGVMGIFLGYGLSLGLVGSGVGTVIGLLFVRNINAIANLLARLTGKPVFDPSVYYFYKIPAIVMPETVTWIVLGAIVIAVAASVLPAHRAARLHPVEALRYE
jgi:lipoprotein-releasing system permease protein